MSERQHGTKSRYHIDGCRCPDCTEAARVYGNHRARQIAYGRWEPYVDAEPARQHVLALRAAGMGPVTIARLSGVPHGALAKLVYGDGRRGTEPSRRIRRATSERVLAIEATIDTLAPGALVDATGTRRRCHALAALGWPLSEQARRLGIHPALYHRSMQSARVTAGRARAVRALFDELSMTPGPSNRTRIQAAGKGYLPPLAWDDDLIDDPEHLPCTERYVDPDRRQALLELDELRLGITAVCTALNVTRRGLEKWCDRHDLTPVYSRLVGREQTRYWANQHTEGGAA